MKLTIYQSDKGDCLLLEAKTGELFLCDGGMRASMREVRNELTTLRDAQRPIDLVYVSHIDNDHITGVLQLLEDEAEWRVFDLHAADDPIRPPKVPRPPVMNGILHNAFRDLIGKTEKDVADLLAAAVPGMLAASVPALFATAIAEFEDAADEMQSIATGIPEALLVSGLIRENALNIPLNQPPGVAQSQSLMLDGEAGSQFALGSLKFTLIGPTKDELANLGKGWATWLRENKDHVKKIRAEIKRRVDAFSNGTLTGSPFDLSDWNGIPNLKGVTAPNVASLMFMVEEGQGQNRKRLLLTGDGQQDIIIDGLERTGFLPNGGFLHLDVLKVQHHGSENNMDANFAQRVSADHYVFCGNGEHANPNTDVIQIVFDSRLGAPNVRAGAPKAQNRDFHFWFSTTSAAQPAKLKRKKNFKAVEDKVAQLQAQSNGRLHLHFNQDASIQLQV
ncbi:MAG: MBL fold metallo-hydrolase [Gemmatimonadota bacterium]